jgi:RNA polymerase sigma-70 factor (sigma-E family)
MADDDFSAFVQDRWTPMVRTAVFLGCALPDAEDVVQTALLRAFGSWDKVRAADDSDAYVYRILLNALKRSRERRWWGERPTADLPEAARPDPIAAVDRRQELTQLLGTLPHDQQVVLVLRYIADLSEAQTAAALGIPAGTVKSRVSRALAALEPLHEEAQ